MHPASYIALFPSRQSRKEVKNNTFLLLQRPSHFSVAESALRDDDEGVRRRRLFVRDARWTGRCYATKHGQRPPHPDQRHDQHHGGQEAAGVQLADQEQDVIVVPSFHNQYSPVQYRPRVIIDVCNSRVAWQVLWLRLASASRLWSLPILYMQCSKLFLFF